MSKKLKKETTQQKTFITFLKSKEQLPDWIILIITCIVGYGIIKLCYPFPATISDSGTYVNAALNDSFTFYRPFGYSYFLQIIHALSSSIHSIFIIQILLYLISVASLSFTVKYFIPPINKTLWRILLFLFIFNPIAFYMSNSIMSDLIFAVMIFFTLAFFIFIIKRQSWIALGGFCIALFFLLHIRYSAIIFPILFSLLYIFMLKGKIRWIAIAVTLFVTFVFYRQVQNDMKETVGLSQFSTGFDGWQMANNGIHVLPFINEDLNSIKDKEIKGVHQFMLQYKDVIATETNNGTRVSARFMWSNEMPLKQFLFFYLQQVRQPYPQAWVKMGSGPYKKYGKYLITKYPVEYMTYFYLPNSKQIFYPNNFEILEYYEPANNKQDIVSWYNLSGQENMKPKNDIYNKFVLSYISISTLIIWLIVAIVAVMTVVFRKRIIIGKTDWYILGSIFIFVAIYCLSTAFAGPVAARFWTILGTLQFIIIYIPLNQLTRLITKKDDTNT